MNLMKWILLYAASHLIIDAVKYKLLRTGKIKKSAKLFIIDQCAHIICIFVIAYMMEISSCTLSHYYLIDSIQQVFGFSKEKVARWILAILIIHEPANILIQSILKELKEEDTVDSGTKGIAPSDMKAGRKIGSIERLIMLLFIAMNQYTAMKELCRDRCQAPLKAPLNRHH